MKYRLTCGRSDRLLLSLASTVRVLVLGPVQIHGHIFIFTKILTCFEKGPPLRREERSGYNWSLPFYWG
jgi:hypothetical protein